MRTAVLAVALAFVALFAGLTLYVLVADGPDVLVVVALGVVGLLAYGVVGAIVAPRRGR